MSALRPSFMTHSLFTFRPVGHTERPSKSVLPHPVSVSPSYFAHKFLRLSVLPVALKIS